MKAGKLRALLERVDYDAEVSIGAWLEGTRGTAALVSIDKVEVTYYGDGDRSENAAFPENQTRTDRVVITMKP